MNTTNIAISGFVVRKDDLPNEGIFYENITKRFAKRRLKLLKIRLGVLAIYSLVAIAVCYAFKNPLIESGLFGDYAAYAPIITGLIISLFTVALFWLILNIIMASLLATKLSGRVKASIKTADYASTYSDELQDYFIQWLKSDTITSHLGVEKGSLGSISPPSIITAIPSKGFDAGLDAYSVQLATNYNVGEYKTPVSVTLTFNKQRNKLTVNEYEFGDAIEHKPIFNTTNNDEQQVIEECL
jgi:hypothetical protein